MTLNKDDDKDIKSFDLPSLPEIRSMVHQGDWGYSIDEDQCFNQHPVPGWLKEFMCFEFEGKWYHLNRLPMGWRVACRIAQKASQMMCHGAPTKPKVFIDGICGVGSQAEATRDLEMIDERAKYCGMSFKEDVSTSEGRTALLQQSVEFVGLVLNLKEKTVSLTKKTPTKLAVLCYRLHTALDKAKSWTIRDFIGCISICFYHAMATAACRNIGRYQRVLQEWARQQALAQTLPSFLPSATLCGEKKGN